MQADDGRPGGWYAGQRGMQGGGMAAARTEFGGINTTVAFSEGHQQYVQQHILSWAWIVVWGCILTGA